MKNRFVPFFLYSAAIILCLTAMAKLVSAGGSARILSLPDPILGLPNRTVLIGVGAIELILAAVILFSKNSGIKPYLIAWFASNLVIYRLGLWWGNVAAPCSCLGTITDALPFSPKTIEWVMKFILAYLLAGSYGILIYKWFSGRVKSDKPNATTPAEAPQPQ